MFCVFVGADSKSEGPGKAADNIPKVPYLYLFGWVFVVVSSFSKKVRDWFDGPLLKPYLISNRLLIHVICKFIISILLLVFTTIKTGVFVCDQRARDEGTG